MDANQAVRLFRDIKVDVLVPLHYESWGDFTQFGQELREVFHAEDISDKVR